MTTLTLTILLLTPVLILLTTVHAINQTPKLARALLTWLGYNKN